MRFYHKGVPQGSACSQNFAILSLVSDGYSADFASGSSEL